MATFTTSTQIVLTELAAVRTAIEQEVKRNQCRFRNPDLTSEQVAFHCTQTDGATFFVCEQHWDELYSSRYPNSKPALPSITTSTLPTLV